MLYFILAPYSAIFVDPFKTVQVRNGYQLFWRKQKRIENHWNLFLDKKPLEPSLILPSPDQYLLIAQSLLTDLSKISCPESYFF